MIGCFGEIMLRLRPEPDSLLLSQAGSFHLEPGGSESNVAIALSALGHKTTMLTGLPENPLGRKVIQYLRGHRVGTEKVVLSGNGRLGLYFTEKGCGHRPSRVLYDREGSVYNFLDELVKDPDAWLNDCSWLHLSGIALATSRRAADFSLALVAKAYNKGIKISLDINHRKQLWGWCKEKKERCDYLMKVGEKATVLVGNETDLEVGLFGDPSLSQGELMAGLTEIAKKGDLAWVAISRRESEQADRNLFGGLIYDFRREPAKPRRWEAKPRTITLIVDRVGTGDAFCGAILDGFLKGMEPGQCLEKAVMLGTLMHGVSGDACLIDENFLKQCLADDSGRILR
ncbi:MAG: sugar kinase [Deltaproteobacteria bacterium]|nr:sugar kinase [Deltaproteobacteria bacterium]